MAAYPIRPAKHILRTRCPAKAAALPKKSIRNSKARVLKDVIPQNAVPLSYIRHKLLARGPEMLRALRSYRITHPSSGHLPTTLDLKEEAMTQQSGSADNEIPIPSHCLAVHGRSTTRSRKVTLFPAHSIVLTSYCPKLADHFKRFDDNTPAVSSTSIPVVPLCLPSPETFGLLMSYFYTQDTSFWMTECPNQLDATRRALLANSVRQNCVALGVQDDELAHALFSAMHSE